jgi:hypothetical protein
VVSIAVCRIDAAFCDFNDAQGAVYGLDAVCIWANFIVVCRLGVKTSLSPWTSLP